MRKTKLALLQSVLALLLCCAMLIGTTFAWFTDSVTSGVNRISAGELDVELEYLDKNGNWKDVTETTNVFAEDTLWEPGHTEVVYLRISNQGSLALKYQLGINIVSETPSINVDGQPLILSEHIRFGVENNRDGKTAPWANRDAAIAAVSASAKALSTGHFEGGKLYPADNCPADGKTEQYIAMAVYMPESVGNEANYMTGENAPEIMLGIKLVATQQTSELDSFDSSYDAQTTFPPIQSGSISELFNVVNGLTAESRTMQGNGFAAEVPVGVKVTKELLTLSISEMAGSYSNIATASNELLRSLDVHMDGVAPDNTVPMKILVENAMMVGLNTGNFTLYHVENGASNAMSAVASVAELDAHNEFYYDPATGDVTLCMATFSEVALVADIENKWNGDIADSFAGGDGTEADPYLIANADQLAMFSAMVGGMTDRYEKNDFAGKFVKLLVNINLGGEENTNAGKIFYPIGYYNSTDSYTKTAGGSVSSSVSSFEGTFDGDGHKITNIYQNTWEMFGDYNDGYSGTPNHYKDAMGLFGYVMNGTVKNLTVDSFSSDGEFTPTGVIAAYAANATFENIAITNCNPRVYNTGNGGIIGIAGNSDDQGTLITLRNITVDNTNKISALWGSWDVACGGLVGMFRGNADGGTGKIHFENCHVSAQIDVNNDVCANYQYYQYRYAGMLIGSIRHNTTVDGRVRPNIAGISANNCTVHFGDWNDYYYCELVANTLASYTHDHQFSRLVQVASVDGTTITPLNGEAFTVPAEGRYNYVVVDGEHATENATCYHFVNGAVWNHENAGTETVGGETVLKEDKQHYYLEFNNLFTGYGWGVNTYNIDTIQEFEGFTNLGNTNPESSVQKFEGKTDTVMAGVEIMLDKLFSFVDNGVDLVPGALTVTVTNKDNTNPVSAVFTRNPYNWANGTLTFTGTGVVQITIQDYYFCKPTTIEVTIEPRSIINGDFEDGITKWINYNGVISSVTDDKFSGNASMKFADDSATTGYTATQKVPVEAGKTYRLSAWVKVLSGTGGYMGLYGISNAVAANFTATEGWELYTVSVTIPEGYSEVTIEIGAHKSQVVTFLIDDVKLKEVESKLPTNGDFEDGIANWSPYNSNSYVVYDEERASRVMKLYDEGSGIVELKSSYFPVEGNSLYNISMALKQDPAFADIAVGDMDVYLYWKHKDGSETSSTIFFTAESTEWKNYEQIIITPVTATELALRFNFHGSDVNCYYVDDILVEDMGISADILVNGNFDLSDNSHVGWYRAEGTGTLSLAVDKGRDGTNALRITDTATVTVDGVEVRGTSIDAFTPKFAVIPGTTYDFSLWIKHVEDSEITASGKLGLHLFFYDENGNSVSSQSMTSVASSANWAYSTQIVTIPNDETIAYADIRLAYSVAPGDDVYIDDVTFKPNLLTNSNFENGTSGWSWCAVYSSTTDDVCSGEKALKIEVTDGTAKYTSQKVTVEPGETYKLSGWVKVLACDEGKYGYFSVWTVPVTKVNIAPQAAEGEEEQWQYLSLEWTAPEETTEATIEFGVTTSNNVTFLIDDIVFEKVVASETN